MTNAYDSTRGNNTDRQRRKVWLLETYRADVDVFNPGPGDGYYPVPRDSGLQVVGQRPACRCYRCGTLLTYETLTVDRIIPGCKGGTYRRNNIRPSCSSCATETGNQLKAQK